MVCTSFMLQYYVVIAHIFNNIGKPLLINKSYRTIGFIAKIPNFVDTLYAKKICLKKHFCSIIDPSKPKCNKIFTVLGN